MAKLEHVFDGTPENFQQLVLENSKKGVVLVNYWTPKAGPCLKLWQVLETLSEEYQGRFLLVNVNTDTQKQLVRQSGVTSVPTVKIYNKGAVVDSIHGAQSERSLRAAIDKHLPPPLHPAIRQALQAYQAGQLEDALRILADASAASPEDHGLPAAAMKLLFRQRRFAEVSLYYNELSADAQHNEDIKHLVIHAELLRLAEEAPPVEHLDSQLRDNPQDFAALLRRAALAMVQDDFEYALECLFYVLQHERDYNNGFAHKAMLSIFALLGRDNDITRAFRQRLRELLH